MDVECLPSGKFATNELILELMVLSYNILRMIGQETIGRWTPKTRQKVHRHKLRTVIGNLVIMSCNETCLERNHEPYPEQSMVMVLYRNPSCIC